MTNTGRSSAALSFCASQLTRRALEQPLVVAVGATLRPEVVVPRERLVEDLVVSPSAHHRFERRRHGPGHCPQESDRVRDSSLRRGLLTAQPEDHRCRGRVRRGRAAAHPRRSTAAVHGRCSYGRERLRHPRVVLHRPHRGDLRPARHRPQRRQRHRGAPAGATARGHARRDRLPRRRPVDAATGGRACRDRSRDVREQRRRRQRARARHRAPRGRLDAGGAPSHSSSSA